MGPGCDADCTCFTYKLEYFGTRCLQKYPMKFAGSGCNRTTGFVTVAKDFMEMNAIAQKNVTLEDATGPA